MNRKTCAACGRELAPRARRRRGTRYTSRGVNMRCGSRVAWRPFLTDAASIGRASPLFRIHG